MPMHLRSLLAVGAALGFGVPAQAFSNLVFSTTFQESVSPNGGAGTWATHLPGFRVQTANGELGPYCDETTDVGSHPHPIVDGNRVLRAAHTPSVDGGKAYAFCASMLTSYGWKSWKYGRFSLVAKVSPVPGAEPAFWLLPANNSWPPEIDVFEYVNETSPRGNYHARDGSQSSHKFKFVADSGYHTYTLDWYPGGMKWSIDGTVVDTRNVDPAMPMYAIFDNAVGLLSTGPSMPAINWHNDFVLKSFKVYQ